MYLNAENQKIADSSTGGWVVGAMEYQVRVPGSNPCGDLLFHFSQKYYAVKVNLKQLVLKIKSVSYIA